MNLEHISKLLEITRKGGSRQEINNILEAAEKEVRESQLELKELIEHKGKLLKIIDNYKYIVLSQIHSEEFPEEQCDLLDLVTEMEVTLQAFGYKKNW